LGRETAGEVLSMMAMVDAIGEDFRGEKFKVRPRAAEFALGGGSPKSSFNVWCG
jgi:hypothetical protein